MEGGKNCQMVKYSNFTNTNTNTNTLFIVVKYRKLYTTCAMLQQKKMKKPVILLGCLTAIMK